MTGRLETAWPTQMPLTMWHARRMPTLQDHASRVAVWSFAALAKEVLTALPAVWDTTQLVEVLSTLHLIAPHVPPSRLPQGLDRLPHFPAQ